jgi:uncharacterized protein YkwD
MSKLLPFTFMQKRLKNYFIPHEGNEYKPHSLQKMAVLGMTTLVILTFTLANLQSLIWIGSNWMVSTVLPAVIVDLTNSERVNNDLTPLQRNSVLDVAANLKAQHMANNQYFSHYSPDGVSPWYWFNQANYAFVNAGENLAIHFTDSDEVVDAWMNSPTHRANIVNGAYTEIGVGAVSGQYQGFNTVYVVQLFGTPALAQETTPAPAVVIDMPAPEVLAETTASEESDIVISEPENNNQQVAFEPPAETVVNETDSNQSESRFIAGSDDIVTGREDALVTLSTNRDPVLVQNETLYETTTTTAELEQSTTTIDESEVVYLGFISTTTGGIPASVAPVDQGGESQTPNYLAIATKPQTVLQVAYVLIGMFVLASLLLSILIEYRRQHPVQIAYGVGLMAGMIILFYTHITITGGAVIV